jgi:hypothetical protein
MMMICKEKKTDILLLAKRITNGQAHVELPSGDVPLGTV